MAELTKKKTNGMTDYEWERYCERLRKAPSEPASPPDITIVQYIIVLEYKRKSMGWMKIWCSEKFYGDSPLADDFKLEAEKHLDHSYHQHSENDTFTGRVRLLKYTETQGQKVEVVPAMWDEQP